MIPEQTFIDFPVFANTGSKVQPEEAKYSGGYVPADVLPAQHANWLFNKASAGIQELNAFSESAGNELRNVVSAGGGTPAEGTSNQVITAIQYLIAQAKAEAILAAHPVGSLYWTSSTENPAITFGGGTWTRIKDKFVLAAGDTYASGGTGGASTVTLTVNQIPSHSHTFTGSAVTSGNQSQGHTHNVTAAGSVSQHSHTISHTHGVTASGTISGGAYTFTGSAVTSGGSSAANTGTQSANHTHSRGTMNITGGSLKASGETSEGYSIISGVGDNGAFSWKTGTNRYGGNSAGSQWASAFTFDASKSWTGNTSVESANHSHTMAHTHSVTASGTVTVKTNPTFTGSSVTSGAASATNSGNATPTFTGTAVTSGGISQGHTHSVTASGSNSNTGGGNAHENMPPYIVKYCWERTA